MPFYLQSTVAIQCDVFYLCVVGQPTALITRPILSPQAAAASSGFTYDSNKLCYLALTDE